MAPPRWLDAREQRMWRAYLEARSALDAATERQLVACGLSSADWQLLVPLSEAPDDTLRARDLARHVGWERSRLSHQLRRMEARGLLARSDCATDARGTMVTLTAAGRAAVEQVAPGHVEAVRAAFVDLVTAEEAALLTAVFERLVEAARPACEAAVEADCPEASGC